MNPLAGCLPVLIQFPVFIGLYRTLLNLGRDRVLEEPFLFLPSLMGPVVAGLPTDYVGVREDAPWLLQNWVDGHPPLGWHDTAVYCVLPILGDTLLVVVVVVVVEEEEVVVVVSGISVSLSLIRKSLAPSCARSCFLQQHATT